MLSADLASPSLLCPRCGSATETSARFCAACGAPLGAAATGHELRKIVTVVFCDLAGSTSLGEQLDPEALRHVLGRYYAEMRAVLERHGGLVEKFIGDAVVAVFGVPAVHEDDALRAARAALEMQSALVGLNGALELESGVRIDARIGVNTGEVVAGDLGPGASFASGDAVNVAARLEQAAGDGEILIGPLTRRLLGDAVGVEPVEPLDLHGKEAPVQGFRLLEVAADAEAISRRFATIFVGRAVELAILRGAFEQALAEPSCRLVTVVGEAGIGKTRLLHEFTCSLTRGARLLTGRCLPYGEGITYWPLAEIVRELGGGEPAGVLAECLASDERGKLVRELLLGAIGTSDHAGLTEEIQWAVRRLFEALGAERPLVVVLEDLHWAEPTFLQLLEYLAGCATGAPILVLAAAREELLETRPSWALPHATTQIVQLRTLPADEAEELVDALGGAAPLSERFRARVVRAGGGNPLFLEQLVALQAENGSSGERLPLPATIKALLAARLDRLSTPERDVLERAAVEGVAFHRGAVTALLPPGARADVGRHLVDAVRRSLVRPNRSEFPDDDGYRFVHVLVHDAVYDSMPKELRAQLHERYAAWLEQTLGNRAHEVEEILGFHLEQAHRLHVELGPPDEHARELADRAVRLLAAGGEAAQLRGDTLAATNLLTRAADILPGGDLSRLALLPDLASAVVEAGQPERATAILDECVHGAREAGDERVEARAQVEAIKLRSWTDPGADLEADLLEAQRLAAVLDRLGDEKGRALAHGLVGNLYGALEQSGRSERAFARAREHATRAGNRLLESRMMCYTLSTKATGPTPVPDALAYGRMLLERADEMPRVGLFARVWVADLIALQGRFADARRLCAEAETMAETLGHTWLVAWLPGHEAFVELIAGDLDAAEAKLRGALDLAGSLGAAQRSGVLISLGEVLYHQDRPGEAEAVLADAPSAQSLSSPGERGGRLAIGALLAARRGRADQAELVAKEAVQTLALTDNVLDLGLRLLDLVEVRRLVGRPGKGIRPARRAIELFENKGATVCAERARRMLAELTSPLGAAK